MSYTAFVIKFTNADGKQIAREFIASIQASNYLLALHDMGLKEGLEVTRKEYETLADMRAQTATAPRV